MAWTLLVSTIITWGPFAIGLALVLASILGATSTQGLVAVIASSYIFFIGLIASLVLAIFTVYSFPSVILDQLSGFAAVRRSFGVASHNLGITVTYSVVRIIFQIISILIMLFAGFIGLPLTALAETVLSLLLTPVLHSTKTMIYYYAGPSVPEMRFALTSPIWNDILRRLPRAAASRVKTGLIESARFIANARNIPFHVASVFSFGIGIFLGYYVSNNGIKQFLLDVVGYEQGRINPAVGGLSPLIQPVLGVDIFLHNWLVSIGTALSGIGFGAPAFGTIIFNGFIIGVLAPLVPNLTMLLAALLPHGIIEIPSFLLAGSVGIKLGYAALKARIGTEPGSREYLASSLRQAVYVVVGLAPLFLLAGLIEADLTPIIMRMFGWTG